MVSEYEHSPTTSIANGMPSDPSLAGSTARHRRLGGLRIGRPRVTRVPSHQLVADLRIGALPEPREIGGDLDVASVRREQVQHDRDATVGDPRCVEAPEEILQATR